MGKCFSFFTDGRSAQSEVEGPCLAPAGLLASSPCLRVTRERGSQVTPGTRVKPLSTPCPPGTVFALLCLVDTPESIEPQLIHPFPSKSRLDSLLSGLPLHSV